MAALRGGADSYERGAPGLVLSGCWSLGDLREREARERQQVTSPAGKSPSTRLLLRSNASFYYSALLKVFLFGNPNKNTFSGAE